MIAEKAPTARAVPSAQMRKVAVVASHPIQYHAPWFCALARVVDLHVFFCHRQDAAGQSEAGFGVHFEWDVPLLDGYRSTWLENRARHPSVDRFNGCDTPEIGSRLRAGHFDACIICGWYLKSYLQALWACRGAGVPVLMRGDSQLATERSPGWKAAKYWPYRWLLGSVDAHLYVGQANREYLKFYGVDDSQLFFVPHFVDAEFFRARADAARGSGASRTVRTDLGIPEDAFVLVFVGKLIQKKHPSDLIRALALARGQAASLWCLIVGSGPLQHELEQLAHQLDVPVRFAGFRNQTEVPRFLAASDALVLPSDGGETWGLVVNEAMACGLPAVVSSAAGCARDLIDEGKTGLTFSVGNVRELAGKLVEIQRLCRTHQTDIQQALINKVRAYSCEEAVKGTLTALSAIVRS